MLERIDFGIEMGSSSVGNAVYCCISKGERILYSCNGGSRELESLVSLCLKNSPVYHKWFFQTVGKRTFGFLMEDGYTYFAIVDPSRPNLEILRFLEHIRDGFKKVAKNGFREELVPIIRRLMASLESMSRPPIAVEQSPEGPVFFDGSPLTKAPLLGQTSGWTDKKKAKDWGIDDTDGTEYCSDRGIKIDLPAEPVGTICVQKSSSTTRVRAQQKAQRLWCRHVKMVIAINVLLCLVLFGIWLAICRGFECVSG